MDSEDGEKKIKKGHGPRPFVIYLIYLYMHKGATNKRILSKPTYEDTAADAWGFTPPPWPSMLHNRTSSGPATLPAKTCFHLSQHVLATLSGKEEEIFSLNQASTSIGYFITHQKEPWVSRMTPSYNHRLLRLFSYFGLEFSTTHGGR